jgi:ribose transport system substrate-binding protein
VRIWRRLIAAGGSTLLLAAIAACGGNTAGGGAATPGATASGTGATTANGKCAPSVLKTLQARLDSYRRVPVFVPPGPAFNISKARGKVIFNIPLLSTDVFNQIVDQAEAQAAKVAGLKFIEYANQGQPSQWVAGMNQAIAQKVSLIILEGSPDPRLLGPQLKQAKQAGIPVISTHFFDTSAVQQQLQQLGDLSAIVPANHYLGSGTLKADYAIVASKCNVNALLLSASDVQPTSPGISARFEAELKKWCPNTCSGTVISYPFSQWATQAQTAMQTALTQNRSINFIAPSFDQGAIYARAAIVAAGAQNRVKIIAYNGSAPVMQMIANKQSVVVDIGEPYFWLGWANIDQALRVLSGAKPVSNENTPLRLFDATNIQQAGNPVSQLKGYGPPSIFENGYKKLWGIR